VIVVADTSALVAILLGEPEREVFLRLLLDHDAKISAGTYIEILRVVQLALGPEALSEVDVLLEATGAEVVPVDAGQEALARVGMVRYGKGRGEEPAVLNFGDLFAYSLAKTLEAPLLYKGDDFAQTDVRSVG
jgi:ribonuclease VapC